MVRTKKIFNNYNTENRLYKNVLKIISKHFHLLGTNIYSYNKRKISSYSPKQF